MSQIPKEGYEWNPLLAYPRNWNCFCGSKKKSKKCCLPKVELQRVCSKDNADKLKKYMKDVGG